jgi:plastocyanin
MRSRRLAQRAAGGVLLLLASNAAAAPHAYTVVIDKLKFGALPTGLHKGDSIVWVNRDILRHSVTAGDHSFDVDLLPGKAGKIVLKKSGAIAFVCRYHPGMRGVLEVK